MKFKGTISGDGYGYVYIMSYHNSKKYKIGHSLNPTTRASDMGGTLAPETPNLEAYFWCSERRSDVERQAHEILKKFRSNGEWFIVSMDDAVKAIKKAATDTSVEIQQVFMNKKTGSFDTKEDRQEWLRDKIESKKSALGSGDYGYNAEHLKKAK
jgi:hypothetical protein